MIDLCIDARMALCSGIGRYIRQLVPLMHDFRVILLVDQIDRDWCKGFEQIQFAAPIYSVKEQIFYPLRIPKCDLFWSPHYIVPLMPTRARKTVVTIHDAMHLALGTWQQKIYAKCVMRKALHHSDAVITDSQFSKNEIYKFLGQSKKEANVVSIGVDHDQFYRRERSEEIRKKYALPDRFILFVGNYKAHKNIEGLIKAFALLKMKDISLVIVGKGTSIGEVLDEELPILYSMAELFVFPSFYEGFGLPPLEAMSCGCPTVVSNAASMEEVCGDASLYFNPSLIDEIAMTITKVLTDQQLKNQLIEKGLERAKMFTWGKAAHRHAEIFKELCNA